MNVKPRPAAVVLAVLFALLLAGTGVSGYARTELRDRDAFAARAASALEDEEVRLLVADRLVGVLTNSVRPDALNVRPLLVPAMAALVGSGPFRAAFERAVRSRHRTLFDGEGSFVVTLAEGKRVALDAVRSLSPRLANAVPQDLELRIAVLEPRRFELVTARVIGDLAALFWFLAASALIAGAACAALAGGARRAAVALGAALTGAGLAVAAAVALTGSFVASRAETAAGLDRGEEREAIDAVWAALFGDLEWAALVLGLAGAVIVAVAGGLPAAKALRSAAAKLHRLAGSEAPAVRNARLAFAVLVGLALLFETDFVLRSALVLAGVALVLWGVMGLTARLVPTPGADADQPRRSAWPIAAATAGAALLIAVVVVLLVLPGPGSAPRAGPGGPCNGARELCRKRLDAVVFPATHNSYAAAEEPGWFFANQRFGIRRQLRDGIRAFLIDVHYGRRDPESGIVRTDLAYEGSSRNKVVRELSPEAVRTAERLAGRIGRGPRGERGIYLCHTLCELGSEPLREQLDLFARFLEDNPREVVILFVEPYVPPEAIGDALESAGLLKRAARLRRDRPLPTLRALIRTGKQLVVLAEDDGGAEPWYLPGFDYVQDTPLGATEPGQLSCRRFRGGPDSPMLMLNHWIPPFPPSVSRNEAIGGEFLRERMRRCRGQRRQLANLPAVDFYERSGVVEASEALNRGG